MTTTLVLTVIGPDRPGLVERISQTIVEHQGNWIESRMARLSGQFAGILRVDLPASREKEFAAACVGLKAEGLEILVAPSHDEESADVRRTILLEVTGLDRPGIVRDIARALASKRVNVDELTTSVESAPMSADQLFRATARLGVPSFVANEELSALLEPIGNDLMVDITIAPVNGLGAI